MEIGRLLMRSLDVQDETVLEMCAEDSVDRVIA